MDSVASDQLRSDLPSLVQYPMLVSPVPGSPELALPSATGQRTTQLALEMDTPRPGLVVLAEAYYPGWRATVNGEPAKVVAVDTMFRGVTVKEGRSQIQLEFAPFSYRVGLYLSLATAFLVMVELRHVVAWILRVRRTA